MIEPTILLTGATGFLGSKILESLLNEGYPVIIIKRSSSKLRRIEHLMKNIKSYDINNDSLDFIFEEHQIDYVIHTACEYGRDGESTHDIVKSNLIFGLQILDVCIKFNTKTFFNTDTLLQKNLNYYTLSKKQFVEWLKLKSSNIQIVNLKIELMYGLHDDSNKFVQWVVSQLRQNKFEIKFTSGEQERDFIYIDDVVSACMTTIKKAPSLPSFSEFDVGTGKLIKVKFFIEELKKYMSLILV